MTRVILAYDGTKYCFSVVDEEGRVVERKCCEGAKQVKVEAPCVVEGYSERPGFVARCEGEARCEGSQLRVST